MQGIKDSKAKIRRLSPADGFHYFYGYYDNPAFDETDSKHLCHRVKFWDRLPAINDICELGTIDIKTGQWEKFAETRAFNFQQGAMLQWNPQNPKTEVIYNVREGNEYRSVIHNIETNRIRTLPAAIANVSRDGKWSLAINMNRIYDFRPGYGYSGVRDSWYDIPHPGDDGINLINMETGEMKLILDYAEMGKLFSVDTGDKLVVNHITFSPDNNRLVFLLRTFPRGSDSWLTGLGTIDRNGKNFFLMNPMSMASHYYWRDKNHLLIWAKVKDTSGMFLLTDLSDEAQLVDPQFFTQDIHCIYSPDRKYIIGDSYFDNEGYRQIYLYNTENGKGALLLKAYSDPAVQGDIRCDLHNRWSRSGKMVSFDSTHEGFRGLYLLDLPEIFN